MSAHHDRLEGLYQGKFTSPTKILLGKNDRGEDVGALDNLLFEMGFGGETPTGQFEESVYDDSTTAAIAAFAQANGVDGIGGRTLPLRLAKVLVARYDLLPHLRRLADAVDLEAEGMAPYRSGSEDPIPDGKKRRDGPVTALQHALNAYYGADRKYPVHSALPGKPGHSKVKKKLRPDGVYGPITASAVRKLNAEVHASGGLGLSVPSPSDSTVRPDALAPSSARKLVQSLERRYGTRWRAPAGDPDRPPVPDDADGQQKTPENDPMKDETIPTKGTTPDPPALPPAHPPGPREIDIHKGVRARLLDVKPVGQRLENWCWAASTEMMIGYLRSKGELACPTCDRSGPHQSDVSQGRQMNRRLGEMNVDCTLPRGDDFDYKHCDWSGWPYLYEYEPFVQSTEWASRRHVLEERGLRLFDGGHRLVLQQRLTDAQLRAVTYQSGREFKRRLDDAEGAALSWETLTALLDDGRPVAFAYRFIRPGVGHMRLAVGYAVTPGNQQWVAVCDPMPPGCGDIHLIPYQLYLDGPYGGHWRDYWVPRIEEGGRIAPRQDAASMRVGRELVASYITYRDQAPPLASSERGLKLQPEELQAAGAAAHKALASVRALAVNAESMAVRLGMGAADTRVVLDGKRHLKVDLPDIAPEDLELDEDAHVPVYEISAQALRDFTGLEKEIYLVLDKPREIIFPIRLRETEGLDFFAAVTVRRREEKWQLSSLGRTDLMRAFMRRDATLSMSSAFSLSRRATATNWARVALQQDHTEHPGRKAQWVADQMQQARQADGDRRAKSRKTDERRLAELEKALTQHGADYPGKIWERRESWKRQELADAAAWREEKRESWPQEWADAVANLQRPKSWTEQRFEAWLKTNEKPPPPPQEVLEGWQTLAQFWEEWWKRLRDESRRAQCRRELDELAKKWWAAWCRSRPEEEWRECQTVAQRALERGEPIDRVPDYYGGTYPSPEPLTALIDREVEIERLCAAWPKAGADEKKEILVRLDRTIRDQEMAWLLRLFTRSAYRDFYNRLLDKKAEAPEPTERPKYILSVPELYQLLIAYPPIAAADPDRGEDRSPPPEPTAEPQLDDEVEPVYETSFHRPEKRVEAGPLLEILKDLQKVARGIDARRERAST